MSGRRVGLVGRPLPRREDERFLSGRAQYLDDLHPEGALHAAFARSLVAHAGLGDVEVGYEREREGDGTLMRGPSVSLGLPIFNQGQGAVGRAQAQLLDARAALDASVLDVQNGVRTGIERLVLARECCDLGDRRHVAVHREHALGQDEFRPLISLILTQKLAEMRGIAVPVTDLPRPGRLTAEMHAGVIEPVGEDKRFRTEHAPVEKRLQHGGIGLKP